MTEIRKGIPMFTNSYGSAAIHSVDTITRSMEEGEVFLPHEIVAEILSRLPVKSLLVLKCVCKLWCSIIEDRHFVRMHLSQTKYEFVDVASEDEDNKDFELLSACHGLRLEKHQTSNKYSIRNPATRTKVDLPDPHHKPGVTKIVHLPTSDNYKVLNVFSKVGDRFGGCEVLTVGIDSEWRKLEVPSLRYLNGWQMRELLYRSIGDVVYITWFSDDHLTVAHEIVCVELETEGFETLTAPNALFASWDDVGTINWEAQLALYKMVGEELHVWVLEDYKNQKWADRKIILSLSFLSKHKSISDKFFPWGLGSGWLLFFAKQVFRIGYHVKSGREYIYDVPPGQKLCLLKSSLVNPCGNLRIPPLLNQPANIVIDRK